MSFLSFAGMGESHMFTEDFSLKAYSREQKQMRKRILMEQRQQGKLAHVKINTKPKANKNLNLNDNSDSDESSESDLDVDEYFFLQPVSTRQRRLLLRSSGVKKIDTNEKEECKDIRVSRESCGCDCRVFCDPETCACSQAGIKCQVDRLSFPCGCSKDGCGNVNGRIEFNPVRVRTHFIHTLMRIELDRKQEQHLNARRLAQKQQNTQNNTASSTTVNLQEPLDNFATAYHDSDVNDNPKDSQVDLTEFNSNELGSCRDCQNTEIADVLMQEAQLTNNGMDIDMCMPTATDMPTIPYSKEEQNTYNHVADTTNKNDSLPCVMLFNDDNDYTTDNTNNAYVFKQEESSYSESSDCSSELSDDGHNFRHFQELSSFPAPPAGVSSFGNGGVLGNGNYCLSSHVAKTHQNGQSYIQLNSSPPSASSSAYKLEPISEILNPMRYPEYQPHNGSAVSSGRLWSTSNIDHFSATYMDNPSQPSNTTIDVFKATASNGVLTNGSHPCDSDTSRRSQDYVYNTDHCPPVSEEDIRCSNNGGHLTDLDSVKSDLSSCLSGDNVHYHEMVNGLSNGSPCSATNVHHNTSPPAKASDPVYSTLTTANALQEGATNIMVRNGNDDVTKTHDAPALYDLPVVNTQSESSSNNRLCVQLTPPADDTNTEGATGNIVCDLDRNIEFAAATQNFGEIIKESIVETVSA